MISFSEVKETPRKYITIQHKSNLVEIALDGGGRIPDVLKGVFTNKTLANKAIEVYLQGKMNGTSGNKSSEA